MTPEFTLRWNRYELILGARTAVMGIVNVTPDSFSDGGQFHGRDAAAAQARRLVEAGADIIDIGGESTRPFADPVTTEEEMERVLPVIRDLAPELTVPISIDTTKSQVAAAALEAGAAMINDISAMGMDEKMAEVAAQAEVPVILMHMKGSPRTMQVSPVYDDVVVDVRQFLSGAMDRAERAGIRRDNLIVDPGIGFGKTGRDNLVLLQRLNEFHALGVPVLVGPSRKRFIRDILNDTDRDDISPELPKVETGTQATVAASVIQGAHIVRVHNVANTRAMVDILDAIRTA